MLGVELFVNQIRGHRVDGDLSHQTDNPDWDTIERAICNLGKHSYAVELCHIASNQEGLTKGAGVFMGISGGAKNAYSVFVHDSNRIVHVLSLRCDETSSPDFDLLNLDELPSTTLDDAIQVARTFAVHGQLDSAFQWRSHPSM
jgi:hypothetical protein